MILKKEKNWWMKETFNSNNVDCVSEPLDTKWDLLIENKVNGEIKSKFLLVKYTSEREKKK